MSDDAAGKGNQNPQHEGLELEIVLPKFMDRQKMCRNCGQGGHTRVDCKMPAKETVSFCHVCKVFGVSHDSLICPSRALTCSKCFQLGHKAELCCRDDVCNTWKNVQTESSEFWSRPRLDNLVYTKLESPIVDYSRLVPPE